MNYAPSLTEHVRRSARLDHSLRADRCYFAFSSTLFKRRNPDTHLQIHSPVARSFRANPGPPVISNTQSAWPTLPEVGCLTSPSLAEVREVYGCLKSPPPCVPKSASWVFFLPRVFSSLVPSGVTNRQHRSDWRSRAAAVRSSERRVIGARPRMGAGSSPR